MISQSTSIGRRVNYTHRTQGNKQLERLWLYPLLQVFFSATATNAQVCTADAFGPIGQDPLTITGTWDIDYGCTLDFGQRKVILNGTLNAEDVTIRAGELLINASGSIVGAWLPTVIELIEGGGHPGSATILGTIDHNDDVEGGAVLIFADGFVTIGGAGVVRARGTATDSYGGSIAIDAGGPITIDGAGISLNVSSGADGMGGTVSLTSSGSYVLINEDIDAHGGSSDGGSVHLEATQYVNVNGEIDVYGATYGGWAGFGGTLTVIAGTDISLAATIDAHGPTGTSANGGGEGGAVELTAGGSITISAEVNMSSGHHSDGGSIVATAGGDFVHTTGRIHVDGRQATSYGGVIEITAEENVTISGALEADGGSQACGGSVSVFGCSLSMAETNTTDVSATKCGGAIDFFAIEAMTVRGTYDATSDGWITFWLMPGVEPDVSGANIAPALETSIDPTLQPCVFQNGDADADGDTDLGDFGVLAACLGGPNQFPDPSDPGITQGFCLGTFDFDSDQDVDLADVDAFQRLLLQP